MGQKQIISCDLLRVNSDIIAINRDEIFFNFKTALIYIKKYDINNSFNHIIIMNHITHTQKHSSI